MNTLQNKPLHFYYSGINQNDGWSTSDFLYLVKEKVWDIFSYEAWTIAQSILSLAEDVHKDDFRKNDNRPYLNHNLEIISAEIKEYLNTPEEERDKYDLLGHILAYAMHDTLEDHSEKWLSILQKFETIFGDELLALQLFYDTLLLATGWIKYSARKEMINFFFTKYSDYLLDGVVSEWEIKKKELLVNIVKLLSPVNPLHKLDHESEKYAIAKWSEEYVRLHSAIELYKHEILSKKVKYKNNTKAIELSDEFIWLGNYIFFDETAARRKLKDMTNNMLDMTEMEAKKPWYAETRRIKAYILSVKLKHYAMWHELKTLSDAFETQWQNMMTDAEMTMRIERIQGNNDWLLLQ